MPAAIRRVALPLVVLCLASAARAGALPPNRNLAGGWQLFPDPHERYHAAALPAAGWRAVRVGLSIQAQFADLRSFAGAAWYRRDLRLPALPAGDSALLHIGACDYRCVVYLNGRRLAAHDGGYLPFDVDLTAAARLGRNRLLIRIADPPGPVSDFRASYAQIPHGKQNWYVQTSGLWQSVRLEFKPAYYILWAHVLSRRREVRGIRLRLAHAALIPAGARARVEAWGPDGTPAFKAELPLPAGQTQVTLPLAWRGRWWSPRHPRLYRFMVTLPDGDQRSGEFGLRSIAERDGRMYLNGRLFYMRAALDQAFYPRGIYTPPSLAYLMREMRQAQALGLNTLRLHIKVPDPRYLQAADRTGMLLWYEIPNWDRLTPLSERRAQTTLRRSIARDWNHPSLILQSIINESWGANLTVAWQRRWLQGMYVWAKAHLPNRLVDDNTACCANFHIQTDLADFHNYNSIPDHAAAWNHFVRAFAGRPKWLFSPYGDARPTGQEPLVLSEFGNWGLPLLPARKPWWFARGFNGNPITIPGGVDRRLRQSALGAVFPSYAALARATEGHEWQALRFEIESLRLQPSIQGYVITELTDVNWESNGLMTMWRRPKIFASQLAALQRPVIVIAQPDRPDYAPGATARLRLTVCNESPQAFTGGTIVLGGHRWPVPPVARGTVRQVAIAAFHLPLAATWRRPERQQASVAGRRSPATATSGSVQNRAAEPRAPRVDGGGAWARPQEVRVRLLRAGRVVDARTLRLAVIGGQRGRGAVRLASTGLPGWRTLARRLRQHGFRLLPAAASGGILLTPSWPPPPGVPVGQRVLVLADARTALPAGWPVRVVARTGNLSGDWISNFNWVNTRRGPFAFLRAFDPVLGREAAAITPRYLLTPPPAGQQGAEPAGFFLGWVHASHALALMARIHKAKVFITTFPWARAYGRDPLATAMLNATVADISAPAFHPRWRLP